MSRVSSLISSRKSVPPLASANLPTCRSVAPVKAPFSWPKRIDFDQRLPGSAPQLTVTKSLPRRSELPWMARARSSLPTSGFSLDQHGNIRFRSPLRETDRARHLIGPGDDVAKSEFSRVDVARRAAQFVLKRVDPERVFDRHLKPFRADRLHHEIHGPGPHGRNHRLNRAMGRLYDRRNGDLALPHPARAPPSRRGRASRDRG